MTNSIAGIDAGQCNTHNLALAVESVELERPLVIVQAVIPG